MEERVHCSLPQSSSAVKFQQGAPLGRGYTTYSRVSRKRRSMLKSNCSQSHDGSKGKWNGKICVATQDVAWNSSSQLRSEALITRMRSLPGRKAVVGPYLLPESGVKENNSKVSPARDINTDTHSCNLRTYVMWMMPKNSDSLLVIVRYEPRWFPSTGCVLAKAITML